MAKSFNRTLLQFNTPSSSDVKHYFLNQNQWKGMIDDKNFLAVDAASFQDCNNVYMDSENVLKSRPAMKKQKIMNGQNELVDITNIYTFGDTIVYETNGSETGKHNLYFVTGTNVTIATNVDNYKLLLAERKIFVFTKDELTYYNMDNPGQTYSGTDFIYVPTTKVITNGVDTETKGESPNELTSSEQVSYIYDNLENASLELINNKKVKVTINDISYTINIFNTNASLLIMDKYANAIQNYGNINNVIGSPTTFQYYYPISYSEQAKSCIYSKYLGTTNNLYDYEIYYSSDNLIFTSLFIVQECIGIPKISKDGSLCIIFKDDGPYCISLLKTNLTDDIVDYKYKTWTNMLSLQSNYASYNSLSISGIYNNQACTLVNGEFYNDFNFSFTYSDVSNSTYTNLKLISCYNGKLYDTVLVDNNDNLTISSLMPNIKIDVDTQNFTSCIMYYTGISTYTIRTDICQYEVDNNSQQHVNLIESITETMSQNTNIRVPLNNCILINKNNIPNISIKMYYIDGNNLYVKDNINNSKTLIKDGMNNYNTKTFRFIVDEVTENILLSSGLLLNSENYVTLYNFSYYSNTNDYNYIAYFNNNKIIVVNNLVSGSTNKIYSNTLKSNVTLTTVVTPTYNFNKLFDHSTELYNYYITVGKTLYISSYNYNDPNNFKWYFPKINTEEYDYNITNLHPISSTEVAVFFEHNISICSRDEENNVYRYYKAKVQVGLKEGNDVITTFDGKYVIFSCERGVVALTYQDFINTDEQALTFLSDNIYTHYHNYQLDALDKKSGIKLYKYNYWIVVYREDSTKMYLFDLRSNSWWPFEIIGNCKKLITIDFKPKVLCNGKYFVLSVDDVNYRDNDDVNNYIIPWYILSQILYLTNMNYYKRIINMTFVSVHDLDKIQEGIESAIKCNYKLQTNFYRKAITGNISDANDYTIMNYDVDAVRTYVIRFSNFKVNEFQYKLSYDEDSYIQLPLSLGNITIKYKLGTEVR